ncbi:MAG: lysylphosphatidylglycerol synthase domain-containing protein, partial [Cyanobacteria bacterium P01_G01_bin.19]
MNLKRFISIIVSVAILLFIYAKIDVINLIEVFKNCDAIMLAIALGMVIPITAITAWRLQLLVPRGSLSFLEANRLILGASVLNMILPSKMGDIAKSYFMSERSSLSLSLAIAISIFEKACDLLSLLLWCVFGLVLYPAKNSLFWIMTVAIAAGLILGILLLGSSGFANLFFNFASSWAPKSIRAKLSKMQSSW